MKKSLFHLMRKFGKSSEMLPVIILSILTVTLSFINFFYLPLFLASISTLIFISLGVTSTIKTAEDLEIKQNAETIRNQLKTLIENTEDGIIVYDSEFKILEFNKAAQNIFDLQKEEIVNLKINPALIKHPKLNKLTQVIFPSLAPAASQISENSWPQVVDIILENPPLQLRTILTRITDKAKKNSIFLKLIRNLTYEKNIIQSKNEFVTIASHQLRTPLTAINWSFEHLLKNIGENKDLKEIIEEGSKLTTQALKTINDLLDITKIEEGQFGYNFQETNITEFIGSIIEQAEPIAKERKIKIIFGKNENCVLPIDAQRLGIAFANLLDNAIKYNTENGEVKINFEPSPNKKFIKINIIDTGVGIPPEEVKKLFNKFYRGSNIIQLEPSGSGLGLYIAKNIIQHHGGEIGVDSTPGRGSNFYFTLPFDSRTTLKENLA